MKTLACLASILVLNGCALSKQLGESAWSAATDASTYKAAFAIAMIAGLSQGTGVFMAKDFGLALGGGYLGNLSSHFFAKAAEKAKAKVMPAEEPDPITDKVDTEKE